MRKQPEPPRHLDGYLVKDLIGVGGMSAVYLARNLRMQRDVALKVLSPGQAKDELTRDRFIREGRLGGKMNHTNVVTYHDMRETDGWLYCALEYVPGGDLTGLINKHRGKVPERLALGLVRDIACGLEAIARSGVVHRDIKPHNIFLTEDMIPKIADFSAAQPAAAAIQADDMDRRAGLILGSPSYMAPEQVAGDKHIDARADIHGLGATLYHMLFGHPPYMGKTAKDVIRSVRDGPPPDPGAEKRRITRRSHDILITSLAKGRSDRFQTPRAMIDAIERALHSANTEELQRARTRTDEPAEQLEEELEDANWSPSSRYSPSSLPFTWTEEF